MLIKSLKKKFKILIFLGFAIGFFALLNRTPHCSLEYKVKYFNQMIKLEETTQLIRILDKVCKDSTKATYSILALYNARSYFIRKNNCFIQFEERDSLIKILHMLNISNIKVSNNIAINFNAWNRDYPECMEFDKLIYANQISRENGVLIKGNWYLKEGKIRE